MLPTTIPCSSAYGLRFDAQPGGEGAAICGRIARLAYSPLQAPVQGARFAPGPRDRGSSRSLSRFFPRTVAASGGVPIQSMTTKETLP